MYNIFHILHLLSLFLLVAVIAQAFAAKSFELRKKHLMISGILSLLVFLTGFGLLGVMKLKLPAWALVKVLCWLVLGAASGFAYRMEDKRKNLAIITIIALFLAIIMVSYKPF